MKSKTKELFLSYANTPPDTEALQEEARWNNRRLTLTDHIASINIDIDDMKSGKKTFSRLSDLSRLKIEELDTRDQLDIVMGHLDQWMVRRKREEAETNAKWDAIKYFHESLWDLFSVLPVDDRLNPDATKVLVPSSMLEELANVMRFVLMDNPTKMQKVQAVERLVVLMATDAPDGLGLDAAKVMLANLTEYANRKN